MSGTRSSKGAASQASVTMWVESRGEFPFLGNCSYLPLEHNLVPIVKWAKVKNRYFRAVKFKWLINI